MLLLLDEKNQIQNQTESKRSRGGSHTSCVELSDWAQWSMTLKIVFLIVIIVTFSEHEGRVKEHCGLDPQTRLWLALQILWIMYNRARWDMPPNHKNQNWDPALVYFDGKFNSKAGLFSSTFWFEHSFGCHLVLLVFCPYSSKNASKTALKARF